MALFVSVLVITVLNNILLLITRSYLSIAQDSFLNALIHVHLHMPHPPL